MAEIDALNREFSLKTRIFSTALVLFLAGMLGYIGARMVLLDLHHPHAPLLIRFPLFALAGLVLTVPVAIVWAFLSRKLRVGKFFFTRAETAARHAERISKMGGGKPFWPQAKYWWLLALMLVGFCLASLLCIGAVEDLCPCPDSKWLRIILYWLAGLCLVPPAWTLFKALRRKRKSGFYLPSAEELAAARMKCARPRPLWWRILISAIFWFDAVLYTDTAISHNHIDNSSGANLHRWIGAVAWWLIAALWTWIIFKKKPCPLPVEDKPQE